MAAHHNTSTDSSKEVLPLAPLVPEGQKQYGSVVTIPTGGQLCLGSSAGKCAFYFR